MPSSKMKQKFKKKINIKNINNKNTPPPPKLLSFLFWNHIQFLCYSKSPTTLFFFNPGRLPWVGHQQHLVSNKGLGESGWIVIICILSLIFCILYFSTNLFCHSHKIGFSIMVYTMDHKQNRPSSICAPPSHLFNKAITFSVDFLGIVIVLFHNYLAW